MGLVVLGKSDSLAQTPSLADALDATQKVWTTGGNASWFGQTSSTHDGVDAARSGAITINQETWMETAVTGPVTVAYWWKVDSEAGYDFLSFAVDGVAQPGMISGAVGWQSKTNSIAPGVHMCRWTFANDESYAEGANAGWVDQVQFLPLYAPSIAILGTDQTVIPQDSSTPSRANGTYFGSAVAITGSVSHTFSVTNSGNAELTVSSVAVDGSGASDFTVLSYPAKVAPGASSNLVLRFNPSIAGIRKAALTIKNNDTAKSNYVFAAEGYGLSFYPSAPRYVWANSPSPTQPYTNWQTSAHTIQAAVDIAAEGDTVWVTNGVYASGGRPVFGLMTNRVAITTPITVRSVNGPTNTAIVGSGPLGTKAVRCVYVSADAWLVGFHLTNGFTRTSGDGALDQGGGGACLFYGGHISNSLVSGCSAGWGGGVMCYGGGTVEACLVTGNKASNSAGGVYLGSQEDLLQDGVIEANSAEVGAGALLNQGVISDCQFSRNRASNSGGGVTMYGGVVLRSRFTQNQTLWGGGALVTENGRVENCLFRGNVATNSGGAVYLDSDSTVAYCTLVDNCAKWGGGVYAEGIGHLRDSIVCFNAGTNGYNYWSETGGLTFTNICTHPLPAAGTGVVTNAPLFVDDSAGDYHLRPGSPCMDAGSVPCQAEDDLDGQMRPVDGDRDGLAIADIGAYEYATTNQPTLHEALDSEQAVWTTGGGGAWFGQTNVTHDGVDAAQSGMIANNQQTWMETVAAGPATVTFWWRLDSIDGYDYLAFSIDGTEKLELLAGSVGWQYGQYGLAPGNHVCRWAFVNEDTVMEGANAGWVDQVQIQPPVASISVIGIDQSVIPPDSAEPSVANGSDFGSAVIPSSEVRRTFMVENSGGLELSIQTVGIAGVHASDFAVLDYPKAVAPGGRSNLVARFVPTASGLRNATLSIQSSDAVTSNYQFAIRGMGVIVYPPAARYVWTNSPASSPPYTNWQTAAHTIQDAVDVAVAGDTVWVTNGVYSTGGRVQGGSIMNRVAINKAIAVQSVNGPEATLIVGHGPVGADAIRCAYVTNNAVLSGFTLTNGATRTEGDYFLDMNGGGVLCDDSETARGLVSNCWIVCNESASFGGGASFGTLISCTLADNYAYFGAGVFFGVLSDCVLSNNFAVTYNGGGACYGTLTNCVLSGNSAGQGGGAANCTLYSCTLTQNYAYDEGLGGGALDCTLDDCTVSSNYAGQGGGAAGSTLKSCSVSDNYAYGDGGGGTLNCVMSDCMLIGNMSESDGGGSYGGALSNCTLDNNTASVNGGGAYEGVLVGCTLGGNSADVSGGGACLGVLTDCGLIGNSAGGGGGANSGALTNCTLSGNSARFGGGTYESTLHHCVLSGNIASEEGGGAYSGTLNNCAVSSNSASSAGGGAYLGILSDCALSENTAEFGGGAIDSTLSNCVLNCNVAQATGGGAYSSTLNGCTLSGNSANSGGGAAYSMLSGCVLTGNSAYTEGGGSLFGSLSSCTLVHNSARYYGGGVSESVVNNSIVYFNAALDSDNCHNALLSYCCTTPDSGGTACITNDPALASAFRLSVGSPCIGAGNAAYVPGNDIDGEPWGVPPSIGCDEFSAGAITGELVVAISASYYATVARGTPVEFRAQISGLASLNVWDFGDGAMASNRLTASHVFATNGLYDVVLTAINSTHPEGVRETATVLVVEQPVHYVNVSNATPAAPFTSWATAAASIQDAIDAASIPGALVLVTNGVYITGGRAVHGSLVSRLAIADAIKVSSVNGPAVTIIQGCGPIGDNAARCAYVGDCSVLSGFTLAAGNTRANHDSYDGCAGGVMCEKSAVLSNCVVSGNSSYYMGGGAFSGKLIGCVVSGNSAGFHGGGAAFAVMNNCALTSNSAYEYGGGAERCTLNNCTLTGNSASSNGGANECVINNSIVYYNTAPSSPNYSAESRLRYCCTTPCPEGIGNITNHPALASASHLSVNSPCLRSGVSAFAVGTDIDGERWRTPPSIGCDEVHVGAITGSLSVAILSSYTNVSQGFEIDLGAKIDGRATMSVWDFGDGSVATNSPFVSHSYATTGLYSVVLTALNESYSGGVSATQQVLVVVSPVHYVNLRNSTSASPFLTWAAAATNIQDAIDAAVVPGATVLVSNGVYSTGGRVVHGTMTNRVAINNAITVRSVNGPTVTVIQGCGPLGNGAVRCVFVGSRAMLSGFTLTNGHTRSSGDYANTSGDYVSQQYGGGVWCDISAIVSNCVISGNSAVDGGGSHNGTLYGCTFAGNGAYSGGGAIFGTLNNCAVFNNSATNNGGGAYGCVLNDCLVSGNSAMDDGGGVCMGALNSCLSISNSAAFGGGASGAKLSKCILIGNSASVNGGGAYKCTLGNCRLVRNTSLRWGGGSYLGKLDNCTLSDNTAIVSGGGSYGDILNNCILYYNTAPVEANYGGSTMNYCCTSPLPGDGLGNISANPQFVNLGECDLRLNPNSPCIDAGINMDWMFVATDLDGKPRIRKGRVDMGAYEFIFLVELKGMLQGVYNADIHAMATSLCANVPLTSPYATDRSRIGVIPPNVVDWALVEILDTNRNTVVSASVLLTAQGRALEAAGTVMIPVEVATGHYYLVLKHRNHLAAMSALPVAFLETVVSYDFTTGADKFFGGKNTCVIVEPGVWGLIGGDADGDGRITPVDREIVERQKGMSGYLQGDLNLDGKVDGGDE